MTIGASIATGLEQLRTQVAGAIQRAANATGAGFDYLVTAARIESNFNPRAAASTSSARGLYQFVDQTWLGTLKEAGGRLGYARYADAITRLPSGRYEVADPAAKAQILALRNDPAANAAMAGVLTNSNRLKLTGRFGRAPTDGELYMAHFLGAAGATRLIDSAGAQPNQRADALFPRAAAANRSIFYNRSGSARSVAEVYGELNGRYVAAAQAPSTRAVAALMPKAKPVSTIPEVGSFLAAFPQAQAPADLPAQAVAFAGGDRNQPVSSAVKALWAAPARAPSSGASGFDLFSDRAGIYGG
jgi:Transglycosylase SLT domain